MNDRRQRDRSNLDNQKYRSHKHCIRSWRTRSIVELELKLRSLCQGVDKFYQAIADKLLARQFVQNNLNLADPLRVKPLDGGAFNRAMEAWKLAGVLPVICLDDFETLLKNIDSFNDGFYDNLRSLINKSLLMLVIASRSKIEDYRRKYKLTSSFFNITQQLELKVFSDQEASDLVRLPHGNPALSDPRQKTALAWGENHPYLQDIPLSATSRFAAVW